MINLQLAEKQGLSKRNIKRIQELQHEKENKLLSMYFLTPSAIWKDTLKLFYDRIVEIEFELQELWGFPKDAKFHNLHGKDMPHCTCPTEDNKERVGYTVTRIVNCTCPVHGKGD